MTDEERTSMPGTEPATGTQTESETTDDQGQEAGLLSRLAAAAKTAVHTVAETTQAAVSAVTERSSDDDKTEHTNADAGATADQAEEPSLAERVGDATQAAVAQVRRVGARVYDQIVPGQATPATAAAEETPASTREAAEDSEAGASFEPTEATTQAGRARRFKDVQPGMQFEGRVTSIALYGIFVDVGVGRDGLVHISEMSDTRVESPTDMVQIGDPVTVWVKSVDPDAWRISLTMRDPNRAKPQRERRPRKPQIDRERLAELKSGDMIEGTVNSIAPFGVFVDIGVGKDGLVHISELAEDRVDKPEDAVQVGERYTFRILEVDPDGKRISLSLRRAQRAQRLQQLEPGAVMDGTVSGMAPFGAFVDIGVGRDGLVHISELSNDRVDSVEEVVKVGDKVQVKVIEIDPGSKRISLTMRVDEPLPAERPQPTYTPRQFDDMGAAGTDEDRGSEPGSAPRRAVDYSKFERRPDKSGGRKPSRARRDTERTAEPEAYSYQDPAEEAFTGDATLEDLVSKFNTGKSRRTRRDEREEGDDEPEEGGTRNRRSVINRTLAMMDEE